MREIDREAILAVYQGHTIFSIFQNDVRVFDQIHDQFAGGEFDEEEDLYGASAENSILRRLHRTLSLPTADWKGRKALIAQIEEDEASPLNCGARATAFMRTLLGMAHGQRDPFRSLGFKPVC